MLSVAYGLGEGQQLPLHHAWGTATPRHRGTGQTVETPLVTCRR